MIKRQIVLLLTLVGIIITSYTLTEERIYAEDSLTVRSIQQALTDRGYVCGPIDGIFGSKTSAAITEFQVDNDLLVDGKISDELVQALEISLSEEELNDGAASENCYGLLIVGTDRRDTTWNGNADAIILVTINKEAGKICFTSIMRDTYADIPGHGIHKINYACAVGGGELLAQTIRKNFDVKIDNYIVADWPMAANVIDLFGGVDIEVKDYEVSEANRCIKYVCDTMKRSGSDYLITGSGYQHLNGIQTVGYCRIRYVGNNDYERTERQREVLIDTLQHLSFENALAVTQRLNDVLSNVSHNFSTADIIALASQYSAVKDYTVISNRIPYDGMHSTQNEMLVPSQPATNEKLKAEIYG